MADAADVFARHRRGAPATRYTALVPNLAGLERAHAAGVTEVAIFAAASETFSRRNINQSDRRVADTYRAVCDRARALGMRVRAYLSTAFGCPFEGAVDPTRVAELSAALIEMGAYEVAVSDTIGIAHPGQVPVVVDAVAARVPLAADRAALPRHARHGARQRARGAASSASPRSMRPRRARRLPLCARGHRQSRHRRSALHARRPGDRDRRRLEALVDVRFIEPLVGHALPSVLRAMRSTPR